MKTTGEKYNRIQERMNPEIKWKLIRWFIFLGVIGIAISCESNHSKERSAVEVDFSTPAVDGRHMESDDTSRALHIAIAAMTSPKETLNYYEELLHFVSKRMNQPIKIEQFKTYQEVNTHLATRQIEMAFICSGAYVEAKEQFPLEILVIPVIHNRTTYNAYIIVRQNSPIRKFEDLRGKSFAYTDPLSNTGRFYAEKRVQELGETPEKFFSKIIYTHAHDYSIQAVSRGIVDGASVDGLIYDYLRAVSPEKVKNVRILEISEDYGIPPVVVHQKLDSTIKQKLRKIFMEMHLDPQGKKILERLHIDKFVEGTDADYSTVKRNLRFVTP
ncbi:MAG: phosphate/phosphite/phosphonate ABC transporter substrate-binding protein [Calditrichaeota bacterium]|nr:MAG: phosphate/phosphite/phosphonate ABC transporter substrate-binding protein [Calditrichota bacterium]